MENIKVTASGLIVAIDHFNKKDSDESVTILSILITDRVKADIVKFVGTFNESDINVVADELSKNFLNCDLLGTYNTKYVTYDYLIIPDLKIELKKVV